MLARLPLIEGLLHNALARRKFLRGIVDFVDGPQVTILVRNNRPSVKG